MNDVIISILLDHINSLKISTSTREPYQFSALYRENKKYDGYFCKDCFLEVKHNNKIGVTVCSDDSYTQSCIKNLWFYTQCVLCLNVLQYDLPNFTDSTLISTYQTELLWLSNFYNSGNADHNLRVLKILEGIKRSIAAKWVSYTSCHNFLVRLAEIIYPEFPWDIII